MSCNSRVYDDCKAESNRQWSRIMAHVPHCALLVSVTPFGDEVGPPFWTRLRRSGDSTETIECQDINSGNSMRRCERSYKPVWYCVQPGGTDPIRLEVLEHMYRRSLHE